MSLWVDATGSDARPPAGAVGEVTLYGILGARLEAYGDPFSANAAARYGEAVSGTAARWVQGEASLTTGRRFGRMGVRIGANAFGLRYIDPFTYSGGGGGAQADVNLALGRTIVAFTPSWSAGAWSSDALSGDLRVAGASVELARPSGPLLLRAGAAARDVLNGAVDGAFLTATAALDYTAPRWTASAHVAAQHNPLEDVLAGGVTLGIPLGEGAQLRVDVGRTLRDPLFGTPGSFALSIGLSVRALKTGSIVPPVVAVGHPETGGRRVRFSLAPTNASTDARTVALTGDFTDWLPRPMEREGGRWILDVVLAPGLHHFGFLVDGQWYVPDTAPGLVEDGWGRENASIIVEP